MASQQQQRQQQRQQQQQQQQQQLHYSSRPSIEILNDDILLRIFDYLHFDDKIRLKRTCLRWRVLLEEQISRVKAMRIGEFHQGGYNITSGLSMLCREHHARNHRQQTGSLFNNRILSLPADLETQCFSINRYDFLHRALKYCYKSITMLSLGNLKISYRLLIVITHNIPNLEHLELIGCASDFPSEGQRRRKSPALAHGAAGPRGQHQAIQDYEAQFLPSVESFNTQRQDESYSQLLYNQHHDEQKNMEQRLMRRALVKNSELVRESRDKNLWPNMKHLLIKECNLLNEFSLNLVLAITNQTLNQLTIESNQYLTGEFLNYCGPQLQVLKVKHCPLFQVKFLEDLVKMKHFLSPSSNQTKPGEATSVVKLPGHQSYPQPINNSMLRNYTNCNQAIYCTL